MTGHSYVIFSGGRNDLFQEVSDALPILLMGYSAGVSHGHTLPIVFQFERIVGGAAAPRGLPVPAIRDHLTVVCNDSHTYLRRFPNITDNGCRLRRSTQHFVEVYSQESGILKSFWDVDSSAARPGRAALANSQTGQCLAGSIAVTADWCFRSYHAARGSADRRSRPAHS